MPNPNKEEKGLTLSQLGLNPDVIASLQNIVKKREERDTAADKFDLINYVSSRGIPLEMAPSYLLYFWEQKQKETDAREGIHLSWEAIRSILAEKLGLEKGLNTLPPQDISQAITALFPADGRATIDAHSIILELSKQQLLDREVSAEWFAALIGENAQQLEENFLLLARTQPKEEEVGREIEMGLRYLQWFFRIEDGIVAIEKHTAPDSKEKITTLPFGQSEIKEALREKLDLLFPILVQFIAPRLNFVKDDELIAERAVDCLTPVIQQGTKLFEVRKGQLYPKMVIERSMDLLRSYVTAAITLYEEGHIDREKYLEIGREVLAFSWQSLACCQEAKRTHYGDDLDQCLDNIQTIEVRSLDRLGSMSGKQPWKKDSPQFFIDLVTPENDLYVFGYVMTLAGEHRLEYEIADAVKEAIFPDRRKRSSDSTDLVPVV